MAQRRRFRRLPLELTNEIIHFVVGTFCRRRLITSSALVFHLLRESKRGKHWKSEALNAREEAATYGTGEAARRALVTRLSMHRNTAAFAWALFRGELKDRYELVDDAFNIRYIILLQARNTAKARQTVRAHFQSIAQQTFIQEKFQCALQFHALNHPHVSWDVAAVTRATNLAMRTNWNTLMSYIRRRLDLVEAGQPLPPPELGQQEREDSPPEGDSPPPTRPLATAVRHWCPRGSEVDYAFACVPGGGGGHSTSGACDLPPTGERAASHFRPRPALVPAAAHSFAAVQSLFGPIFAQKMCSSETHFCHFLAGDSFAQVPNARAEHTKAAAEFVPSIAGNADLFGISNQFIGSATGRAQYTPSDNDQKLIRLIE
ncbi:hypothetical protein GPALN_003107 [Globodera pallida]|nr:hypothetical protein GPALN_003107 [Globodera pallida]